MAAAAAAASCMISSMCAPPKPNESHHNNATFSIRKHTLTPISVTTSPRASNANTHRSFLPVPKAAGSEQTVKTRSIICGDCEGNGAVQCSQCKGSGVNSVDHFNGRFKAGALCWLCRGKREVLCGNCNGAGFVGGFLSTQDE